MWDESVLAFVIWFWVVAAAAAGVGVGAGLYALVF